MTSGALTISSKVHRCHVQLPFFLLLKHLLSHSSTSFIYLLSISVLRSFHLPLMMISPLYFLPFPLVSALCRLNQYKSRITTCRYLSILQAASHTVKRLESRKSVRVKRQEIWVRMSQVQQKTYRTKLILSIEKVRKKQRNK